MLNDLLAQIEESRQAHGHSRATDLTRFIEPETVSRRRPLKVAVTIDLVVEAAAKHRQQMQQAAMMLTNDKRSVRMSHPSNHPKRLVVEFSIPKARQVDVVDRIGRAFWQVEDYRDSSIGFFPSVKRRPSAR